MVDEYKRQEYKPYPSLTLDVEPTEGDAYDYSVDELTGRLKIVLDKVSAYLKNTRDIVASKAMMNTERDEALNVSVRDVWDGGTELPLLIYEVVGKSQNARHQYIADVALEADRGVSGAYELDRMDLYKIIQNEAQNMMDFLLRISDENQALVPMYDAVWKLEQVVKQIPVSMIYKKVHLNYYTANREEDDPVIRASQVQKNIHQQVATLNSTLTANKRTMIALSDTADTFYKEKIPAHNTEYSTESIKTASLIESRATQFEDTAIRMLKIFSTGNSIKETWHEQSQISTIRPSQVAQQAYISNNPKNLSSANQALIDFAAEVSEPMSDASMVFIRKDGYTEEDAVALVDMLNSLPETHTYISAGIINVRANPDFVSALIGEINNMPPNSTLISGGMIALIGKTLEEFQEEVEGGAYGGPGASVQEVIDALNESAGGVDGLTILLPGVIGLTGDDDIREAIVEALNTLEQGSTLIGPGAVLVQGGNSLADKASSWDSDIAQNALDIAAIEEIADGEIQGFFQDTEPVAGMYFGDIWIDTTGGAPLNNTDIYRYQNDDGSSADPLIWDTAPTNAIGLAYLDIYNNGAILGGKITTYYDNDAPTDPPNDLVTGDLWIDTDAKNKLYRWNGSSWDDVQDENITDLLDFQTNTSSTLSYFGITDSTLIDGGKVMTSGVLADYLLSGMEEAGSPYAFDSSSQNPDVITIGSTSLRLREIRSTTDYTNWPATAAYLTYKIEVSVDGTNYEWVRGDGSNYMKLYRQQWTDNDSSLHDTPLVFILDGCHARYVRLTFGGYYEADDDFLSGDMACNLQAYGAAAYIDGGVIMGETLLIGSFSSTVQDTLNNADEVYDAGVMDTITNFDARNDRIGVTPAQPTSLNVSRELNTDGTSNLLFTWSF